MDSVFYVRVLFRVLIPGPLTLPALLALESLSSVRAALSGQCFAVSVLVFIQYVSQSSRLPAVARNSSFVVDNL